MKRIHILTALAVLSLATPSCNYLDHPQDSRTELNRADKIERLLVSAYPNLLPMGFTEHRTDNVADNGPRFTDGMISNHEGYYWEPNSETDWDTEYNFWNTCYHSIMTANQALKAIEDLGSPTELRHSRGEALLCRAYTHFLLVNVFSQIYNGQTSQTDKGVPYFTEPEHGIGEKHPRLSVATVYKLIEADLLEGMSLIDDDKYTQPLYHFTTRAAKAFATQFYCYYEQWDKAKQYADQILGTGQVTGLRDVKTYNKFTQFDEVMRAYINPQDKANIMLLATRSLWGRRLKHTRFAHNSTIASKETYRSGGGWGANLWSYDRLYGSNEALYTAKFAEVFEITDVTAQTGQPHIIGMPFDLDKVLLWRAEARVMLKDYAGAASDLSAWYISKEGNAGTAESIAAAYDTSITADLTEEDRLAREARKETVSKPLNPKFAIESGLQTNLMHAVLHARRVLTAYEGYRWDDIRRFGIEIKHSLADGTVMTLKVDDHRRASQIPAFIREAGMEGNPGY